MKRNTSDDTSRNKALREVPCFTLVMCTLGLVWCLQWMPTAYDFSPCYAFIWNRNVSLLVNCVAERTVPKDLDCICVCLYMHVHIVNDVGINN